MTRRKRILLVVCIVLAVMLLMYAAVLAVYSAEQNKTVIISEYTVEHDDIPVAFDGKRIVHLTDLHNKDFGGELETLVAAQHPDIIVITGDWIGFTDDDITPAKEQVAALTAIAPVYFTAGNHEKESLLWPDLEAHLLSCGVTVLDNKAVDWTIGDEMVQLIGVFDPEFSTHLWREFAPLVQEEQYTVLLYHRPEYMEKAAEYHADLILSGHTHGGQIRLPLIGAVFAPNQGWFPKYDVGRFDVDSTTMIVGQGLGESVYFRILTPPEIVTVTLKSK